MSGVVGSINWEAPVINGSPAFFSEEAFRNCPFVPSLKERLENTLADLDRTGMKPEERTCTSTSQEVPTLKGSKPSPTKRGHQERNKTFPTKRCHRDKDLPSESLCKARSGTSKTQLTKYATAQFPKKSVLTCQQQRTYLDLYSKFLNFKPTAAHSAKEVKEISLFKELQLKVVAEQQEFSKFLETNAQQHQTVYDYIHPEVARYVQEMMEHRRRQVERYPRYYTLLERLSPVTKKTDVIMKYIRPVLELGVTSKVILPHVSSNRKVSVPTSYSKVAARYPPTKTNQDSIDLKKVCSEDAITESLAFKYEVDVAMTSSAFKCLVDNGKSHQAGGRWTLPVLVKQVTGEGDAPPRKVVFIDKPLIPENCSTRDQNSWFHGYALKTLVCHSQSGRGHKIKSQAITKQNQSQTAAHALLDVSGDNYEEELFESAEDVETFGVDAPSDLRDDLTCLRKKESSKYTLRETMVDVENTLKLSLKTDSIGAQLMVTAKSAPAGLHSFSSIQSSDRTDSQTGSTESNMIEANIIEQSSESEIEIELELMVQDDVKCQKQEIAVDAAVSRNVTTTAAINDSLPIDSTQSARPASTTSPTTKYTQPSCTGLQAGEHRTSTLDNILEAQQKFLNPCKLTGQKVPNGQSSSTAEDSKQYRHPTGHKVVYSVWQFGELRILVRTTEQGALRDDKQRMREVGLAVKMEYQPHYGFEQKTASEAARLWATSFLRNNCNIVRARINAFSSDLMMLEDLDANNFLSSQSSFSPDVAMGAVHSILNELNSLGCCSYLLYHNQTESHFDIKRCTSNNKRGPYDLHASYMGYLGLEARRTPPVQWIPLDPAMFLRHHKQAGRVPCTFQPSDWKDGGQKYKLRKTKKNRGQKNKLKHSASL